MLCDPLRLMNLSEQRQERNPRNPRQELCWAHGGLSRTPRHGHKGQGALTSLLFAQSGL